MGEECYIVVSDDDRYLDKFGGWSDSIDDARTFQDSRGVLMLYDWRTYRNFQPRIVQVERDATWKKVRLI